MNRRCRTTGPGIGYGAALVLADAPSGSFDTAASDEVLVQLQRMHVELGTTFVMITHAPRLAARCGWLVAPLLLRFCCLDHWPGGQFSA